MSTSPGCCTACGCRRLHKNGSRPLANGLAQVWKCAGCGHRFTGAEKYRRAGKDEQALALQLSAEGLGVRAIARVVGRFPRAVELWLQKGEPAS